MVPTLHFSGNFEFHMPECNNDPAFTGFPFDPDLPKNEVLKKCGCNPAKYFEFSFENVTIKKVTYKDATSDNSYDPVIGKQISLTGFLVDVSPSAIVSQLYAISLNIASILDGTGSTAVQSVPRLNKRPLGIDSANASADFISTINVTPSGTSQNSRYFSELSEITQLQLVFTISPTEDITAGNLEKNGYVMKGLVLGHLSPPPAIPSTVRKTLNRKLITHTDLLTNEQLLKLFVTDTGNIDPARLPKQFQNYLEVEGDYDLDFEHHILSLRCLHFIPYLNVQYETPTSRGVIDRYNINIVIDEKKVSIASFTGSHEDLLQSSGLQIIKLPDFINLYEDDFKVEVTIVKDSNFEIGLLMDNEWDIELNGKRTIYLPSGNETAIEARVYRHNAPAANIEVQLINETKNRRSPIVASFDKAITVTDGTGKIAVNLKSIDLLNTGNVFDPVTDTNVNVLPIDRNYGNFLFLEITNRMRTFCKSEMVELAVRVLHKIDPLPAVPSFDQHIKPLFSYHTRFFPFLHVSEIDNRFSRFFDIESYAEFARNAGIILTMLKHDVDHRFKMPRSRDLPYNSIETIERWIETGMSP